MPKQGEGLGVCEQQRDAKGDYMNVCKPCFRRGIPCFWTRVDWLGGNSWFIRARGKNDKDAKSRDFVGKFFNKLLTMIYHPPVNEEATKLVEIPDPGFKVVSSTEETEA